MAICATSVVLKMKENDTRIIRITKPCVCGSTEYAGIMCRGCGKPNIDAVNEKSREKSRKNKKK